MRVLVGVNTAGDLHRRPCHGRHVRPVLLIGRDSTHQPGEMDKTATGPLGQAPIRSHRPSGGAASASHRSRQILLKAQDQSQSGSDPTGRRSPTSSLSQRRRKAPSPPAAGPRLGPTAQRQAGAGPARRPELRRCAPSLRSSRSEIGTVGHCASRNPPHRAAPRPEVEIFTRPDPNRGARRQTRTGRPGEQVCRPAMPRNGDGAPRPAPGCAAASPVRASASDRCCRSASASGPRSPRS